MTQIEEVSIATWNIGGAKFLKQNDDEKKIFRQNLHTALQGLTQDYSPDVILLQESVRYYDPNATRNSIRYGKTSSPKDLIEINKIPGYHYSFTVAIDTKNQSHPQKWQKYRDEGDWSNNAYLAQGYGILWKNNLAHAQIWDIPWNKGGKYLSIMPDLQSEVVRLETGLFTGSRDSEPRLAVVSHFVVFLDSEPLDIFVVNLHLTTLNGEREGSPSKDVLASKLRSQQLETVANGCVSRYNEWLSDEMEKRKKEGEDKEKDREGEKTEKEYRERFLPIWVLGGDLNCMPKSQEITTLKQMNFIDLNPSKGGGTKGTTVPLGKATITLDYLFAGPAYYAIDPYLLEQGIQHNSTPLSQYQVSDHFPIFAKIPIDTKVNKKR